MILRLDLILLAALLIVVNVMALLTVAKPYLKTWLMNYRRKQKVVDMLSQIESIAQFEKLIRDTRDTRNSN